MLLIDQRFCITPPYRTTRPGTLIRPTSVAAVICQAVSPLLSHEGAVTAMNLLLIGERLEPPSRQRDGNPGNFDATIQPARPIGSNGPPSSVQSRLLDIGINGPRKQRETE